MTATENEVLRVDKWLWFTRFYKTRALASKAVTGGHVKVNGERAKPATSVRAGDVIEIVRDQLPWRLTVEALPQRRGPAREARTCYQEDEHVAEARQSLSTGRRMDRLLMPTTEGKPDKHTRRKLRARRRPG
jgi:ribosome-associated heat shock protein Hsp15